MNAHKNARTCPLSRALLIQRVFEQGWSVRAASEAVGITDRRGREWVRRAEVGEPLTDRSSRPHSARSTPTPTRTRIIALRRQWLTVRQIAKVTGVSPSTAARVCRAAGLNRLKQLDAPPPPVRYERDRPGELLHIDIKRLGRFDRPGHRITRRRSQGSRERGFEFVHVATDDASRVTYAEILPDECASSAMIFVSNAIAWFARHGVTVERIMSDNGSAFISYRFRDLCQSMNVRHLRIRPHTPQTNGKVERVIQTLLREWAYRFCYGSSEERKRWLVPYLHFYNFHRAHSALAYNAPISRLDRKNVLRRNS
ncbi:MAG: IS481 family transposase [Acidobacteria bacterium]|nr:MAG: IS481 family transposase [Acidobacteriota bacterium]